MSIVESLTRADDTLARQLDRVTEAVSGIGSATLAAKKRLTLALDAARQRMTAALADIESLAGELAEDILTAAGEDLLALPEPVPDAVVQASEPEPERTPIRCCDHCGEMIGDNDCACQFDPSPSPLRPLTPEEAVAAYDAAVPVPISAERIDEIVKAATSPNGRAKKRRR